MESHCHGECSLHDKELLSETLPINRCGILVDMKPSNENTRAILLDEPLNTDPTEIEMQAAQILLKSQDYRHILVVENREIGSTVILSPICCSPQDRGPSQIVLCDHCKIGLTRCETIMCSNHHAICFDHIVSKNENQKMDFEAFRAEVIFQNYWKCPMCFESEDFHHHQELSSHVVSQLPTSQSILDSNYIAMNIYETETHCFRSVHIQSASTFADLQRELFEMLGYNSLLYVTGEGNWNLATKIIEEKHKNLNCRTFLMNNEGLTARRMGEKVGIKHPSALVCDKEPPFVLKYPTCRKIDNSDNNGYYRAIIFGLLEQYWTNNAASAVDGLFTALDIGLSTYTQMDVDEIEIEMNKVSGVFDDLLVNQARNLLSNYLTSLGGACREADVLVESVPKLRDFGEYCDQFVKPNGVSLAYDVISAGRLPSALQASVSIHGMSVDGEIYSITLPIAETSVESVVQLLIVHQEYYILYPSCVASKDFEEVIRVTIICPESGVHKQLTLSSEIDSIASQGHVIWQESNISSAPEDTTVQRLRDGWSQPLSSTCNYSLASCVSFLKDNDVLEIRRARDGNVGARVSLEVAMLSDVYNESTQHKLHVLSLAYTGYRKIRGDGNCYYRAIIFGILEQIINSNDRRKFEELRKLLQHISFPGAAQTMIHSQLLVKLTQAAAGECWLSVLELEADVLQDITHCDLALVGACRQLVAQHLLQHRTTSVNELSLEEVILPSYGDVRTMEEYCDKYIATMGSDAEGVFVELGLLPQCLHCSCTIVFLDRIQGNELKSYSSECHKPIADVHVMLRPGHYDLLYQCGGGTGGEESRHCAADCVQPQMLVGPICPLTSVSLLKDICVDGSWLCNEYDSCRRVSFQKPDCSFHKSFLFGTMEQIVSAGDRSKFQDLYDLLQQVKFPLLILSRQHEASHACLLEKLREAADGACWMTVDDVLQEWNDESSDLCAALVRACKQLTVQRILSGTCSDVVLNDIHADFNSSSVRNVRDYCQQRVVHGVPSLSLLKSGLLPAAVQCLCAIQSKDFLCSNDQLVSEHGHIAEVRIFCSENTTFLLYKKENRSITETEQKMSSEECPTDFLDFQVVTCAYAQRVLDRVRQNLRDGSMIACLSALHSEMKSAILLTCCVQADNVNVMFSLSSDRNVIANFTMNSTENYSQLLSRIACCDKIGNDVVIGSFVDDCWKNATLDQMFTSPLCPPGNSVQMPISPMKSLIKITLAYLSLRENSDSFETITILVDSSVSLISACAHLFTCRATFLDFADVFSRWPFTAWLKCFIPEYEEDKQAVVLSGQQLELLTVEELLNRLNQLNKCNDGCKHREIMIEVQRHLSTLGPDNHPVPFNSWNYLDISLPEGFELFESDKSVSQMTGFRSIKDLQSDSALSCRNSAFPMMMI